MSDMSELITEMKRIKEDVHTSSDKVREKAEEAIALAKEGKALTEKQKATTDELMVKQGEALARLDDFEQKLVRRGADEKSMILTPGQQFTDGAAFKSFIESGERLQRGQSIRGQVKAITSLTASGGLLVAPDRLPGIVAIPQRPATVRDLLAPGRTSSNLIQYFRELVFTNNTAPVAEGTRKPESDLTFEAKQAIVIKLAHFIKATTEILDDVPAMQSMIEERLLYGLRFVEDVQLLMGSGVGNNLAGIYTTATAYVAPFVVAGETNIDRLRLAFLQGELALLPADAAVLHPTDWAKIELIKDTQGRYIIGNPQGNLAPTLWGRRIVTTLAMTAGNFLAGNFRQSAQIFDRETADIVVSTENESDFVENKITILAEERLALADYRPAARIKGAFL
ncbi:MAG TPA: phage major capsid protein [Duganella sp.]|uniref:phage major capsid protein n=1 Tax=Duganella sp. TaxID=1904440 RepID=UPI002ED1D2DA